jgi:hypothetical protein
MQKYSLLQQLVLQKMLKARLTVATTTAENSSDDTVTVDELFERDREIE